MHSRKLLRAVLKGVVSREKTLCLPKKKEFPRHCQAAGEPDLLLPWLNSRHMIRQTGRVSQREVGKRGHLQVTSN